MRRVVASCVIAVVMQCIATRLQASEQPGESLWQQAANLEKQGRSEKAADIYATLVNHDPASQKAATRLAIALIDAGRPTDAAAAAEKAVAIDPFGGYWAEQALLARAKAYRATGQTTDARQTIHTLRCRFPDATATARAVLIEAELDGADVVAARTQFQQEEAADALHDSAVALVEAGQRDAALAAFDRIIREYPNTRKSLRTRKVRALLLGLAPDRTEETRAAWQDVLQRVTSQAPHSVLRYEAEYRLAALEQREDRPDQAMQRYLNLEAIAQDPRTQANAAWQGVGAHNELLQKRSSLGEKVSLADWDALRDHCKRVKQGEHATPLHKARADLIIAESYHWQGLPAAALDYAQRLIATYDENIDPPGVATARLIAGECLQRQGLHQEALLQYRWITAHFPDQEIWPGLADERHGRPVFAASLARTYFGIYDALRRGGAAPEEVSAAAEVVLTRFAETQYVELVRTAMNRESR